MVNMTQLVVTIPAEFNVGNSTTCAVTSGSCSHSSGVFTISGVGLSLSNYNIILTDILLPFISVSSTSFSI